MLDLPAERHKQESKKYEKSGPLEWRFNKLGSPCNRTTECQCPFKFFKKDLIDVVVIITNSTQNTYFFRTTSSKFTRGNLAVI